MTQATGDVQAAIADDPGRRSALLLRVVDPLRRSGGGAFRGLQSGARTMEIDLRLGGWWTPSDAPEAARSGGCSPALGRWKSIFGWPEWRWR